MASDENIIKLKRSSIHTKNRILSEFWLFKLSDPFLIIIYLRREKFVVTGDRIRNSSDDKYLRSSCLDCSAMELLSRI